MVDQQSTAEHLFDDDTKVFLQQKVQTLVRWDLIRFFHDNPHTKDIADKIAEFIGRDILIVERELDGLVYSGILQVEEKSGLRIYHLAKDDLVRETINNFMQACHNHEFRAEAIHYVIQEMQDSNHNNP